MKNSLTVLMLLFSILACSDKQEAEPKSTAVKIRLRNTSAHDYTDVLVRTGGGEFNYGNIKPNENTVYHDFEYAYSYAYVRLKITDESFVIQPIDFVGEKKLESGNYTYEIGKDESSQSPRLTISLVAD
jgi:hypothetical protein